jgi:hypothetical protein
MPKPNILKQRDGNQFQKPSAPVPAAQVDSEIFGATDTSQYITADPISIREIWPDVTQPRRSVPSELRQHIHTPQELLMEWQRRAMPFGTTKEQAQYVKARLKGENLDAEMPYNIPAFAAFIDLVDLAASIYRDGLTNPITVVMHDNEYYLETGERRWLAYHLLYRYFGDAWLKIPARIVDHIDVWRQASENSERANLNMVSRARQYAKLVMALYAGEMEFGAYNDFLHDRHFYAQAADLRVPRGKGEQVMAACGIKSRSVLNTYRRILNLDDDVWTRADDDNWTENQLFGVPNNSPDDENIPTTSTKPTPPPKEKVGRVQSTLDSALKSQKKAMEAAERAKKKQDAEARLQLQQLAEAQMEWWRKYRESLDVWLEG